MNKFTVGIIVVSIIALLGGATLLSKNESETKEVVQNANTEVSLNETSYDWGNVGINDGNVEHIFEIKNDGSEALVLTDVTTSCMCTTASLILGEDESPAFGMHQKSDYKMEIPAGETAKLKVIFDPAFHGPSGVGPINRTITVSTNNPDKPELKFMLTAMVRK